jgi:hypothetical protein
MDCGIPRVVGEQSMPKRLGVRPERQFFPWKTRTVYIFRLDHYTALGHKLRFFKRWKAQFVTVGIIFGASPYLVLDMLAAV